MSDKIYSNKIQFDNQISDITEFKNNNTDTAEYIHHNYHKMDEIERVHLLNKILHDKTVFAYLLKYELRNLNHGKKYRDFFQFIKFVDAAFIRYHMWAGGQLCEDNEWTKYTNSTDKYPLNSNEVIYENSIKKIYRHSLDNKLYIFDLLNFFNLHHAENISVKFKMIPYTDEIYLMVLIVKLIS